MSFLNHELKMERLADKKCIHGDLVQVTLAEISEYLEQIPDWTFEGNKISKKFTFQNYKDAMEFVNKVAEIAEQENHHPHMEVSYNNVVISLTTHSINGLSKNDFIIAAKINNINKKD